MADSSESGSRCTGTGKLESDSDCPSSSESAAAGESSLKSAESELVGRLAGRLRQVVWKYAGSSGPGG